MTRGSASQPPTMRKEVLPVFIGYDSREEEAYQVAKATLLRHASIPVHVQPLDEWALRQAQMFTREWKMEGNQRIDTLDGRPFSTEFSFTRFLIPSLCQWQGWALFVDCDFLFKADIAEVQKLFDNRYAIMCCRQDYQPKETIKMDGQAQQPYNRKNWSSFMAFNCAHRGNKLLTPFQVNHRYGSWLHSFSWLLDAEIGDIDHRWNWIEGTTEGEPKAIHYTAGGPWFRNKQDAAFARDWMEEAIRLGLRN